MRRFVILYPRSHIPLLHTIRDITLSRSGQFALISHELKVGASMLNSSNRHSELRTDPTPIMEIGSVL